MTLRITLLCSWTVLDSTHCTQHRELESQTRVQRQDDFTDNSIVWLNMGIETRVCLAHSFESPVDGSFRKDHWSVRTHTHTQHTHTSQKHSWQKPRDKRHHQCYIHRGTVIIIILEYFFLHTSKARMPIPSLLAIVVEHTRFFRAPDWSKSHQCTSWVSTTVPTLVPPWLRTSVLRVPWGLQC